MAHYLLYALLFLLSGLVSGCSAGERPDSTIDHLSILTLNLHGYQQLRSDGAGERQLTDAMAEQRIRAYGPILDRMASGIDALDPDIVCLQEVAEWPGQARGEPSSITFGVSESNMVHQILGRLGKGRYHAAMDWSHFTWQVWLEGSAILSRYPIRHTESRFISSDASPRYESWKSRNVPMAVIDIPTLGPIAVFSVHAGWWDDPDEPSEPQFRRLMAWAEEVGALTDTVVLCGDFNAPAESEGYDYLTAQSGFSDAYLVAKPDGMFDATIGGGADGWEDTDAGERIDYILVSGNSSLQPSHSERVFTPDRLGVVSDHAGVYVEFRVSKPVEAF